MKQYTFIDNLIEVVYKDACGVNPTKVWIDTWNLSSAENKQKIWDKLCNKIDNLSDQKQEKNNDP